MKGFLLVAIALIWICVPLNSSRTWAQSVWATAYYAGWMQGTSNNGYLTAQNIDYTAMTHIVHFSLVPNTNGTLDAAVNGITATNSSELVTRAHAAGKPVIICVGGWGSDGGFRGATSNARRATFVANLVSFMTSRGYDGIDIDWEPLASSDAAQYTAFITELRTALDAVTPRPLLTAATAWHPAVFVSLASQFDQINIMTYDLSGAWPGWVTWHNAPVYDGGHQFPGGGTVPSINGMVNSFIAAGVPAQKLGIGIDFYGYVWSGGSGTSTGGATAPRQSWNAGPSVQANVPYYTIMQNYYQSGNYRWDTVAQAAYLSFDNAGSSNDKFISYDNEAAIQKKFDYARSKGIGGLIVWELAGGYRPELPAGQRDPLLQAVKTALNNSPLPIQLASFTATAVSPTRVRLDWMPLSEFNNYGFEVQRSANTPDNYQTLPNSFVPGHGTTTEPQYYTYTDSSVNQGSWFYRLKQIDLDLSIHYTDGIRIDVLTGVGEGTGPTEFGLMQNYPNPFNPSTTIAYSLAEQAAVSLRVYNVLGEEVATLISETLPAGTHEIMWNASDVASGTYIYRLEARSTTGAAFIQTRKLILLK